MKPSLRPGEKLGGYTVEREIGRGGMSIVYLAHDRQGRAAALKVLLDAQDLARFQREAVQQLDHPHIVRVRRWGEERGYHYLVMDYVSYGSLHTHLQKAAANGQHLGLKLSLEIAGQVARGLAYAHRQGVVHRDIKPSNILLERREGRIQAKIIDFGVARLADGQALTKFGAVVGTPDYMSPEQAKGYPADERSDIYSLGLVLYHMLAGRPPVLADSPVAMLHQQVYETPPGLPHVPEPVQKVVFKAIAKNPRRRYQRMDDLIQALERVKAAQAHPKPVAHNTFARVTYLATSRTTYLLAGGLTGLFLVSLALGLSGGAPAAISGPSTAEPSPAPTGLVPTAAGTLVPTNTRPVRSSPTPRPTVATPPRRPASPTPAASNIAGPELLYPAPDAAWTNLETPEKLVWRWERELAAGEIFVVTVYYRRGDSQYPAEACVATPEFYIRQFKWLIDPVDPAATSTVFEWTVRVMQAAGDDCRQTLEQGRVISQAPERRRFEWVP